MKHRPSKKFFVRSTVLLAVILLFISFHPAHAQAAPQTPNLISCMSGEGNLVSCGLYYVSWIINGIFNVLIELGGLIIQFGLTLSGTVFDSPTVQKGFSVALAVANLGFVLGIIMIALATILRLESYGVKKMLGRLVAMAILVNFGLVIAAPIVGFADNLTNYFVQASGGQAGFVTNLTSAFAPQALFQKPDIGTGSGSTACNVASTILGGPGAAGLTYICNVASSIIGGGSANTGATQFTQSIFAMVFSAIFAAIVAITFIAIGIMLVIRYVYLSFLLVVLPLAWLTWIFPKFSSNFSKWWQMFIKWSFFPALSLFFVYLAFQSVSLNGAGNVTVQQSQLTGNLATGPAVGIAVVTATSGLAQTALNELLLCGLCLGGLVAANSLSIKGADTALGAAKWAGGQVTGYVGRQAKKGARATYQGVGGNRLNAALQRSRIPFVSTIGRGITNATEKGGKKLVEDRGASLNLAKMSDDRLTQVTQGMRGTEDQIAAVAEWQKRGKLHKIEKVGGTDLTAWLAKNKRTLENYDQKKLSGDINKILTSNNGMRTAAAARAAVTMADAEGLLGTPNAQVSATALAEEADKRAKEAQEAVKSGGPANIVAHNQAELQEMQGISKTANEVLDSVQVQDVDGDVGAAGQMVRAGELMRKASEKFFKDADRSDAGKMHPEQIFSNEPKFGLSAATMKELGKAITHGVATKAPTLVNVLAGKIEGYEKLSSFIDAYTKSAADAYARHEITNEEFGSIQKSIERTLGNRLAGYTAETHAEGAGPSPTPPPAPPAGAH